MKASSSYIAIAIRTKYAFNIVRNWTEKERERESFVRLLGFQAVNRIAICPSIFPPFPPISSYSIPYRWVHLYQNENENRDLRLETLNIECHSAHFDIFIDAAYCRCSLSCFRIVFCLPNCEQIRLYFVFYFQSLYFCYFSLLHWCAQDHETTTPRSWCFNRFDWGFTQRNINVSNMGVSCLLQSISYGADFNILNLTLKLYILSDKH